MDERVAISESGYLQVIENIKLLQCAWLTIPHKRELHEILFTTDFCLSLTALWSVSHTFVKTISTAHGNTLHDTALWNLKTTDLTLWLACYVLQTEDHHMTRHWIYKAPLYFIIFNGKMFLERCGRSKRISLFLKIRISNFSNKVKFSFLRKCGIHGGLLWRQPFH